MSIQKVEMYTVVCDNCNTDIGSTQDYSCWNDKDCAEENAMNSEWIKVDNKHYCDECVSYDDNDNLVLKEV